MVQLGCPAANLTTLTKLSVSYFDKSLVQPESVGACAGVYKCACATTGLQTVPEAAPEAFGWPPRLDWAQA